MGMGLMGLQRMSHKKARSKESVASYKGCRLENNGIRGDRKETEQAAASYRPGDVVTNRLAFRSEDEAAEPLGTSGTLAVVLGWLNRSTLQYLPFLVFLPAPAVVSCHLSHYSSCTQIG